MAKERINLRWRGNQLAQSQADAAWEAVKPKRRKKRAVRPAKKLQVGPVDYYEYLKSKAWQNVRKQAFRKYGRRCQICGATRFLQVHHKTYVRLGRERLTDLSILCDECHSNTHDKATDRLSQEFRDIVG